MRLRSLGSVYAFLIIIMISIGMWVMLDSPEVKAANPDHSSWMWDRKDELHHFPITRLVIPGSHDSFTGSFDKSLGISPDNIAGGKYLEDIPFFGNYIVDFVGKWGKTQNLTITEQLNYGIRYFDLRMCGPSKVFFGVTETHHCHGLYADPAVHTLNEIADFSREYPNELLILQYSHFTNVIQSEKNSLAKAIYEKLGHKLVPNDINLSTTTLGDLWEEGRNILVIYEDADGRQATGQPKYFWDEEHLMINGWTNSQDEETLRKRVIENLLCRCNINEEKGANANRLFNLALQPTPDDGMVIEAAAKEVATIGNGGTLRDVVLPAQFKAVKDIRSHWNHTTVLKNINIISADFVEEMMLVEFALELNNKIDLIPPTAEISALTEPNEAGWYNQNVLMELKAIDEKGPSGVMFVQYQMDAGKLTSVMGDRVTFEVNKEGVSNIKYRVADRGLNYTPFEEKAIKLDKSGPEVNSTGVRDYTIDEDVLIGCTAEDSVSGVKNDPCTAPLVDQPALELGVGEHTITVTATDIADNITTKTITFNIVDDLDYDSLKQRAEEFVQGRDKENILNRLNIALDNAATFESEGKTKQRNQMLGIYQYELSLIENNQWLTQLSDEHAEILKQMALAMQRQSITDTDTDKQSTIHYVALGDKPTGQNYNDMLVESIRRYGYNTIFNREYSVPGNTSQGLLDDIRNNVMGADGLTIKDDITQADVITIDIGLYDIQQEYKFLGHPDIPIIIQQVTENVDSILTEVRQLNASADIYVLGLYDPFQHYRIIPGQPSNPQETLTDAHRERLAMVIDGIGEGIANLAVSAGAIFIPTNDIIGIFETEFPIPSRDNISLFQKRGDILLSEEGHSTIADAMWSYAVQIPYIWSHNSHVTATDITSTSVTLEWNAANGDVEEYAIFNGSKHVRTVTGTVYQVDGLTPETNYNFKVEAIHPNGMLTVNGSAISVQTEQAPEPDVDEPVVPDTEGPFVRDLEFGKESTVNPDWLMSIDETDATLLLPSDLPKGTKLTVTVTDEDLLSKADKLELVGDALNFEFQFPEGYEDYEGTFTLMMGYNVDSLNDVDIYYYNEAEGRWEIQEGTDNKELQIISLDVTHFSNYGVFIQGDDSDSEDPGDTPDPEEPVDDPDPEESFIRDLEFDEELTVHPNWFISILETDATLLLPSDLPKGTKLTVTVTDEGFLSKADKLELVGDALNFEFQFPEGYEDYEGTFTLMMGYNTDSLNDVDIYYYNEAEGRWESQKGTDDKELQFISLGVTHFSNYGVFTQVSDLDPEDPVDTPDPEDPVDDPDLEDPIDDPDNDDDSTDKTEVPVAKDPSDGEKDDKDKNTKNNELPHTATNYYNWLLLGAPLLLLGIVIFILSRKRRLSKERS